jgi:organic radical activating enzyme
MIMARFVALFSAFIRFTGCTHGCPGTFEPKHYRIPACS